ncbi:PASTA domain-containing protein [Geobacter sp. DSM 9736]|uniref:PASTA domain-containing protein n=1 Tax=Geobacter sp. DSM 9736 TaxID=1277350 RepID=UPI0012FDF946|nr:PASTA domain-containing protein [Geobacter sp. DSM 9736]
MNFSKHFLYKALRPVILILLISLLCSQFVPEIVSAGSDSNAPASVQSQVSGQMSVMPDVINADLDKTGRRLTNSGLKVVVRRDRQALPLPRGAKRDLVLPEVVRPFRPSEWSHLIAGQEPAAGTTLRPETVVTLTAGIHHGAGPYRPWLETHGGAVKRRGELRCRDCHEQKYCSGCHNALRQ